MRCFGSYSEKLQVVGNLRTLSLSFIFLFSCLGFVQPQLDDYAPGVKVRAAGAVIVNAERQPKRYLGGLTQAMIADDHSIFTAVFIHCFVKFDRKQNTRLWPFVTVGTTRAPPATFSV
jgi:hypothetical protein